MHGRAYVTPQDVKSIAPPVLRHRIMLTYEAEAEDVTTDQIIGRIFDSVAVPLILKSLVMRGGESVRMLSPPTSSRRSKRSISAPAGAVNTLMAGQYKSVFRGSGIEFEEVREYSPGR